MCHYLNSKNCQLNWYCRYDELDCEGQDMIDFLSNLDAAQKLGLDPFFPSPPFFECMLQRLRNLNLPLLLFWYLSLSLWGVGGHICMHGSVGLISRKMSVHIKYILLKCYDFIFLKVFKTKDMPTKSTGNHNAK